MMARHSIRIKYKQRREGVLRQAQRGFIEVDGCRLALLRMHPGLYCAYKVSLSNAYVLGQNNESLSCVADSWHMTDRLKEQLRSAERMAIFVEPDYSYIFWMDLDDETDAHQD